MPSELIRKAKVASLAGAEPSSAPPAEACDHCGDSLAGLKVVRRQLGAVLHSYCCNGCAFIAEQLFLAQAGARDREALNAAVTPGGDAGTATQVNVPTTQARIEVRGMVCVACAQLIEHLLRRLPGVTRAHVDFPSQRAFVDFDEKLLTRDEVLHEIRRAGYETGAAARDAKRRGRVDLLRLLIAWLMMMQVMMLSVPLYFAGPGDVSPDIEQLMRIASLILTLPVMLFSAQPLYRAAWSQVRIGSIGMDVPIVLGIGAAFGASAVATLGARGQVYFDSVTMFVALVLGTRWLLARGLAAAREHIETARRQASLSAQRLVAFPSSLATETLAAERLRVGDRVLVPPGETVPADGVVVHGRSSCSQAWLTGESTPIEKAAGAPVLAGSVNLDQPMVIEVTRRGEATSLAALQRLVDEAGRDRPRVVEFASRVAVGFLWAVLGVTLLTLVGWWLVEPARALPNAIAVLVATCPCALSLAAPAAFSAAQSALAQRRVLLARTAALEALAEVQVLACDKTGTLTSGDPALLKQLLLRDTNPEQMLAIAAAMETMSTHPYARALLQAAQALGVVLPTVVDGRVEASAGIEGTVGKRRYRLGKIDFALAEKLAPQRGGVAAIVAKEGLAAASYVVLADEDGPLVVFVFGERMRDDAPALVDAASDRGIEVVLLSGDRREPVQSVARALGIERALAHQTPDSKRSWVAGQQAAGRRVAMLGDGLNDAPVIAQADVSIALAGGSMLAQTRADFIVLNSRLVDVEYAISAAYRARRIVRQNLGWAFIYNVVIIPLAAFGIVSPALAAAGMAASSLGVVANALRARNVSTGGARPR
ncbi:MAG TPA: cation-translocating P-type ATPase [Burkholderiaceae bacterium]|nr:cation-translocating P-type ATPase [Burkholderiaceae bacterium]